MYIDYIYIAQISNRFYLDTEGGKCEYLELDITVTFTSDETTSGCNEETLKCVIYILYTYCIYIDNKFTKEVTKNALSNGYEGR